MIKVGYVHVSTTGQNLDTQLEVLSSCEKVFREKSVGLRMTVLSYRQCQSLFGKVTQYK